MDLLNAFGHVRGRVYSHRVHPSGENGPHGPRKDSVYNYRRGQQNLRLALPGNWEPATAGVSNLVMNEWTAIVGELLCGSPDGKAYNLGAMYMEFANSLGEPVTPPTIAGPLEGVSYYQNMPSGRDYLRVPLTAVVLSSTDDAHYPNGNLVTVFAQSSGTVGQCGQQVIDDDTMFYGGALVVTPQFSDITQDRVFSRFYLTGDSQLEKLIGSQIGLRWPIQFS